VCARGERIFSVRPAGQWGEEKVNLKLRVFVFDDDEQVLRLLNRILTGCGCEVVTFSDACAFCSDHPTTCQCSDPCCCADAVLSDVSMPSFSGLDLFDKMTVARCRIPNRALISGRWNDADLQTARAAGFKVFRKPPDFQEVKDWLATCERQLDSTRILSDNFRLQVQPLTT
jgi:CheY-like chemotaxis protein